MIFCRVHKSTILKISLWYTGRFLWVWRTHIGISRGSVSIFGDFSIFSPPYKPSRMTPKHKNMCFSVWWHNFGTWKMHQNHPKNDQNHWKITKISFYVHLGTCIHIYGSLGVIWTSFRVFEIFPTENPFKNAPKHTKWPANHSFRGLKYVKSGLKSPKIDQNMVKTPNSTPQTHINMNRPHKENARMADF